MAKTLGLSIPELVKPEKDFFFLKPRKVDDWLDSLPRGNVGETARQIFDALVESNHYSYPYQARQHFLDASRETVLYVTDAMKRHFVSISAPLPEKNRKIASATREIHHAMAIGYMITIENMLQASLLFSDNHSLATLIQRAISSFGRVLLTSYQTYTPYPNAIWASIHKLYLAAEQRKIHAVTIKDEHYNHSHLTTICAEYVRLLLVALTSPYRLRQGEVGKVYEILPRWVSRCRLHPLEELNAHPKARFGVDLLSDEPPRAVKQLAEHTDTTACRIMDSETLTHTIRKDLKQGFKTGETTITGIEMTRADLSRDLMRRLLIAWCIFPKRNFSRSQKDEKVQVTLGLTTTHQVIISGNPQPGAADDMFAHEARFEANNVRNNIRERQPDVWDMIYFPTDTDGFGLLEKQFEKEQASGGKKHDYSAETWLILNESAQGYCLQTLGDTRIRAQVGELVGIRRHTADQTWKWGIGVIRWLRSDTQNELMIGVEMLTPDAAAIGMRAINSTGKEYQRTLMLPELPAVNQPTTLVTPSVPYRTGQKLVINLLGKEIMIQLNKQVQNSGLFAQFQFEILEQQTLSAQDDSPNDGTEPDFSGVWSSI